MNIKNKNLRRKLRTRSKINGTDKRPRLSVFKSNRFIYAQLIDDKKGKTLVSVSERELKDSKAASNPVPDGTGSNAVQKKTEKSKILGEILAKKATLKKIKEVIFDKGRFSYKGRVKSFAEGAREGGLKF